MVGLNFPIFGSAGDKNHITVRFQIKSSPQTEIHTPSSPKTVSALFSTPWIFQILYATLLSRCIEAIPRPNSELSRSIIRLWWPYPVVFWAYLALLSMFQDVRNLFPPIRALQNLPRGPSNWHNFLTEGGFLSLFCTFIKNKNFKIFDFSKIFFSKKIKFFLQNLIFEKSKNLKFSVRKLCQLLWPRGRFWRALIDGNRLGTSWNLDKSAR